LIIALSGAVASGKTTVGKAILDRFPGVRLSTRETILARTGVANERTGLQEAGDRLDVETDGGWVADAVADALPDPENAQFLVVDAVRKPEQVRYLRERFGSSMVRHVHVIADDAERARRHKRRAHDVVEPDSYDTVRANLTEADIDRMALEADITFDATRLDPDAIAAVALAGLGLTSRKVERLVDVIVGGQYGSEGKGNVCAYLAGDYQVLMRVGGPNAGHRVKDPDYDFVHLPSGSLHNPRARLLIGAGATLQLKVLMQEIKDLSVTPERLSIDPQAIIIEDEDIAWEAGELEVIGSTKKGVGVATARKILNRGANITDDDKRGFGPRVRLARDIDELAEFVRSTLIELERAYAASERVMLEGTQGTDLSLHHGLWPHVTSRETSAAGCMSDAGVAPDRVRDIIMVTRTYPIRVGGTSGYMGIEIDMEEVAERSGLAVEGIRETEVGTVSKKPRRIAEFDLGQIRRAGALNGASQIALTFADYISDQNIDSPDYEHLTEETHRLVEQIEEVTGIPVTLISTHPTRQGMVDRRRA
jgi:adenylosuccinate synthase